MSKRHRSGEKQRMGVMATDPLRLAGFEEIFGRGGELEVLPVTAPEALQITGLSVLVIDAACTDHLFELLAAFRRARSKLKVIVVGLEEDHEFIERVIGAGAKGYLTHMATEVEIRMAMEIVLDGSVWAPRKVMARLLDTASRGGNVEKGLSALPRFTPREREVLTLLIAGRPNRDIASMLKIDEGTVKAHVGRLMRKVGVDNRIALTMQAVARKLLDDGGSGV